MRKKRKGSILMSYHLLEARYVYPSSIFLRFADGLEESLSIERLEMPVDRIRWATARALPAGDAVVVETTNGETVAVDSSTLRYLVDKNYASELDALLNALQFTRDELKTMTEKNRPPVEWYREPDRDARLDSWK